MKQRTARFTAAALALAISQGLPATAQTRQAIVPSVSIAHVYDDNLFADVEGSAGQMLQIRPSLEGSYESPRLTLLSVYSQDMLRSNHGDLNTLDARRHAFLDTKFRSTPMTTFGVAARYDRSETPGEIELDTGILGRRQTAERWQVAPNFARRMGPRTVLTGGYDWTQEHEIDTPKGTMHQGRLAISREFTTRTDIVGSYLGRYFDDSFEAYSSHALLAGFSREVAPGTQFSFYAGPRITSYRSGFKPEVSTGFIRATPRINLALDYWHGETIILGIPGPVAADSGTARVSWPLTAKLELGALGGVTDIDTIDLREARVYRTALLGSWTTRGMYTVGASYGLDYQEGDIRRRLDEDVLRHVFRVSLTVAPRLSHSILPPDEAARVKGGSSMIARFVTFSVAVLLVVGCSTRTATYVAFAQEQAPAPSEAPASNAAGSSESASTIPAPAAAPAASAPAVATVAVNPRDYRIGPEDVLDIQVWKNPDLSRDRVPVRPDGKVSLPLVNDIQAAGLTANQLRAQLAERLVNFIQAPEVSVIVREVHSVKVSVQGNVNMPGQYEVKSEATVLEMISRAQGFNTFANKGSVWVVRRSGGRTERLEFKYDDAIRGRNGADFFVTSGDVIIVQ